MFLGHKCSDFEDAERGEAADITDSNDAFESCTSTRAGTRRVIIASCGIFWCSMRGVLSCFDFEGKKVVVWSRRKKDESESFYIRLRR
jgi:hypothetical protein